MENEAVWNTPLESKEQTQIILFCVLLLPSIIFMVGIIPVLMIGISLFLMKKNKNFSPVKATKNVINILFCTGMTGSGLCLIYFAIKWHSEYLKYKEQYDGGYRVSYSNDESFYASLIVFAIFYCYYYITNKLFFSIIEKHQIWIVNNGIFSKYTIVEESTSTPLDIIKGEKFKHFSVADELIKWSKLKEDGHISEEEFNEVRKKLLNKD